MVLYLILFLFLIINIIVPNKEKSVQENRMLATKPKFRLSSLISGDYDEKFEAYMDDQFVGRDMWRKLKVTVDRKSSGKWCLHRQEWTAVRAD